MADELEGTVALVTGASSGIGEATARQLAALGAGVAIAARRRDRLDRLALEIQAAGGRALAIQPDVTDRVQAQALVAETVQRLGRLDIVVNNAGVMLLGPMQARDVADAIAYVVTRPRRVAINEVLIRPTEQEG